MYKDPSTITKLKYLTTNEFRDFITKEDTALKNQMLEASNLFKETRISDALATKMKNEISIFTPKDLIDRDRKDKEDHVSKPHS